MQNLKNVLNGGSPKTI